MATLVTASPDDGGAGSMASGARPRARASPREMASSTTAMSRPFIVL